MSDRTNALLTNSQREKLQDREGGYSRQHRQRIRERTREGTRDLSLLFQQMEVRDIEQVFEPDRSSLEETFDILKKIQNNFRGSNIRRVSDHVYRSDELLELVQRLDELTKGIEERKTELKQYRDSSLQTDLTRSDKDTRIHELENEIDNNKAQKEELIKELQAYLEQRIDASESFISGLKDSERLLHKIPLQELPADFQKRLDDIESGLRSRKRQEESIRKICYNLEEDLEYDHIPWDDISYLQEEIREIRNNEAHGRRGPKDTIFHQIREFTHRVESELSESQLDPDLRDDFVNACAFFLRVSDVLDLNTEGLMEEALITMYEQEHSDEVVEHSIVSIESIDKETAAREAKKKDGEDRLSNSEVRALAELDPDSLVERYDRVRQISEKDLIRRVRENPELLEEGLEIEDLDPKSPGSDIVPDLVARDTEGNIVLIEAITEIKNQDKISKQIRRLIESYGGKDRVKAILIAPEEVEGDLSVPSSLTDVADVKFIPGKSL